MYIYIYIYIYIYDISRLRVNLWLCCCCYWSLNRVSFSEMAVGLGRHKTAVPRSNAVSKPEDTN